jgi:hypothetical protein
MGRAANEHFVLRARLTPRSNRRAKKPYPPASGRTGSHRSRTKLRVAFSASSKSDYQQTSVIKVEDPSRRADLAARTFDAVDRLVPPFLVFCADARRLGRLRAMRAHPRRRKVHAEEADLELARDRFRRDPLLRSVRARENERGPLKRSWCGMAIGSRSAGATGARI